MVHKGNVFWFRAQSHSFCQSNKNKHPAPNWSLCLWPSGECISAHGSWRNKVPRCCRVDRLSADVYSSGEEHDDDDDDSRHAGARPGHPGLWRAMEEQRWAPPSLLLAPPAPDWSPCLECNLPAICRPPQLCLIFKQTPVKSPCLISHSSWKLAKVSTPSSHQKTEGKRGQMWVLFQPSGHVLNIDFYGRLKGPVLLSTKMSKNNRPVKVLRSPRCLHNKLFQIQFVFFSLLTSAGTAALQSRCNDAKSLGGCSQMGE